MNIPPAEGAATKPRPVLIDVLTGQRLRPETLELTHPQHRFGLSSQRLERVLSGERSEVFEVVQ